MCNEALRCNISFCVDVPEDVSRSQVAGDSLDSCIQAQIQAGNPSTDGGLPRSRTGRSMRRYPSLITSAWKEISCESHVAGQQASCSPSCWSSQRPSWRAAVRAPRWSRKAPMTQRDRQRGTPPSARDLPAAPEASSLVGARPPTSARDSG
jgi:hypothetical protein